MKLKIIISLVLVVVVVGGIIVYLILGNKNSNKLSSTANTPVIQTNTPSASRDGFPSLNQLESISNYTSTSTVSNTITYTQYVYSPSNYKSVTGNITTIVYDGTSYSKVGTLSYITKNKVTKSDNTDLILYAEQINGLFNDPVVKVKKLGSCAYASQEGRAWEVYFNQLKSYAQAYFACTDINKGYLLALNEGANLGSSAKTLTASFQILGINNVPSQFNPSDL